GSGLRFTISTVAIGSSPAMIRSGVSVTRASTAASARRPVISTTSHVIRAPTASTMTAGARLMAAAPRKSKTICQGKCPVRRSSTRTQVDAVDAPGPAHDLDRVAPDRVADAHPVDLVAQLGDLGGIKDRPERLGADVRRPVDPQNRVLIIGVGVAEIQKKEEPVELRLRQRKGAFELDRVLGRDDQERVRQRVR